MSCLAIIHFILLVTLPPEIVGIFEGVEDKILALYEFSSILQKF